MKTILVAIAISMIGVACGSAVDPEPTQEPGAEKTEQAGEAVSCIPKGGECMGTAVTRCCSHICNTMVGISRCD